MYFVNTVLYLADQYYDFFQNKKKHQHKPKSYHFTGYIWILFNKNDNTLFLFNHINIHIQSFVYLYD